MGQLRIEYSDGTGHWASNYIMDPYYAKRCEDLAAMEQPYPHKVHVTKNIKTFIDTYTSLAVTTHTDTVESVAGRVMGIRPAGNLYFMDMWSEGSQLQFVFSKRLYVDQTKFKAAVGGISRGDMLHATGFVGKTNAGELSLFVTNFTPIAPCLRILPTIHYGIADPEIRAKRRFLDMIVNPESLEVFKIRSQVLKYFRNYLDTRGFMELETPILQTATGGATAKPFKTHMNDGDRDLYMRIATELPLKMAIVGGVERVYDMGPQFRNETFDTSHHPSFTSIEFYQAYADYNDLLTTAEEILSGLVKTVTGSYKLTYDGKELDFTPPFARYDFVEEIEKGVGIKLPTDFSTDEARQQLDDMCVAFGVVCTAPRTTARLLDKLCGHFIEPRCIGPSFIMNHPQIMSPLAKWHRTNPQLSERFELFISGFEFCNSYTELNDPRVQRRMFEDQAAARASGDDEAQSPDEVFLEALEYGLPPLAGQGWGIDRLVMLLTGKTSIRDVIFMPLV